MDSMVKNTFHGFQWRRKLARLLRGGGSVDTMVGVKWEANRKDGGYVLLSFSVIDRQRFYSDRALVSEGRTFPMELREVSWMK